MRILDRIPLWSLFATGLILCILMTYGGHDWGGDFAAYLGQARALAETNVGQYAQDQLYCAAHSDFSVGPAVYGWGFPLILAPLYGLFGLSLAVFKALMMLFLLGSGLLAYFLFHRSVSSLGAKFALALLLFSPALTASTNQILSDLPFTFFFLAGFLIMRKWEGSGFAGKWALLLGGWIFYSTWIRPNGALLLAPIVVWACIESLRRQWRRELLALLPIGVFVLCFALAQFLLPSHRSDSGIWNSYHPSTLWNQLRYYLWAGGEFYLRNVGRYLFWLSLPPFLYGMAGDLRERWPIALVFSLTIMLYLAWPATQGIRFLYPLFPIYCFYIVMGFESFARRYRPLRWALPAFALVVTVHFAFMYLHLIPKTGPLFHKHVVDGPYAPASQELWKFVDTTKSSTVISFFKPRVLYLYARRVAVYNASPKDTTADYFVVGGEIEHRPPGQEPIFENYRFSVFDLRRR